MKIYYFSIFFLILVIGHNSSAKLSLMEYQKLKMDANYSNFTPTTTVDVPRDPNRALLIVKSVIPNLEFQSNNEEDIRIQHQDTVQINNCLQFEWKLLIKAGHQELKLKAQGFEDFIVAPRNFIPNQIRTLDVNIKDITEEDKFLQCLVKPDSTELQINGKVIPMKTPFLCKIPDNKLIILKLVHPNYKCFTFNDTINISDYWITPYRYEFPKVKPKGDIRLRFEKSNIGKMDIKFYKIQNFEYILTLNRNANILSDSLLSFEVDSGFYRLMIHKEGCYNFLSDSIHVNSCDTTTIEVKFEQYLTSPVNTESLPKIAIRFNNENVKNINQLHLIRKQILSHYNNPSRTYLLSDSQASNIFYQLKSGKKFSDLKKNKIVNYAIDFSISIPFVQSNPESNMVKLTSHLLSHKVDISFTDSNYFKEFHPKIIDSRLTKIDNIFGIGSNQWCQQFMAFIKSKYAGPILIAFAWLEVPVIIENLCIQKRKKLPDAPPVPIEP